MRAALIISFLLIYYSGSSVADLSIRYDTIGKHQQKPLNTLLIKQGLVRINPPVGSEHSVAVVSSATSGIKTNGMCAWQGCTNHRRPRS